MNMDPRLSVGGNNPPDPIDEINARFESVRMEAENWTDGEPVENEAQMKALDVIREKLAAADGIGAQELVDTVTALGFTWGMSDGR